MRARVDQGGTANPKNKKGKTAASTSSSAFDETRFLSAEHQKRFENWYMPRKIISERKIELDADTFPYDYPILEVIDMRKWDKLVSFPEESSSIILKEFCANVDRETVKENRESWVRGKKVFFFPAAIERFLKTSYRLREKCAFVELYNQMLPTEHKRMYSEHMPELADKIRQGISGLYSSWVTKKGQPLVPEKIHKSHLTGETVFWHQFINSTVMPSTHLTHANLERATLYYTLMRPGNLSISQILSDEIVAMVLDGNPTHLLGHSSLVSHLCRESGVVIPNSLVKDVPLEPTLKSAHYENYVKTARKQTVVRAAELSEEDRASRSPRCEPRAPQTRHREAESFLSAPLSAAPGSSAPSSSRSTAPGQPQETDAVWRARIERRMDRQDRRQDYEISMLETLLAHHHLEHLVLRPESPPSSPPPQPEEPHAESEDTSDSSSDDGADEDDVVADDTAVGSDAVDIMDE